MRETIGLMLIVGWLGFWVWLWFTRPETFRKLCGGMEKAVDDAAGKAADAVHREVQARRRQKQLPQPPNGDQP